MVSYLPRLADALTPLIDAFGQPTIQALSRIWQVEADLQRGHLAPSQRQALEHIWQTSLDEAAHGLAEQPLSDAWDALSACLERIWRGSMAAEWVNSLLRPWLDGRKQADQGTLNGLGFRSFRRPDGRD